MRNIIVMIACAVAGCINAPQAQHEAPVSSSAPASYAKPAAIESGTTETASTETAAPATAGLADLDAMTFDCPKAGLNAAARAAARIPSQGTYQFSYFRIINDAHHAAYEVHFRSNYVGEPTLRYCVSIYCQQGWNPGTTRTDVRLMSDERTHAGPPTACSAHPDAAKKK
jgi:hypothetical protein